MDNDGTRPDVVAISHRIHKQLVNATCWPVRDFLGLLEDQLKVYRPRNPESARSNSLGLLIVSAAPLS